MTLRQRTFRAGVWTVASYSVELSSRLFSSLIMTRLLLPDAFAMIAAAMGLIVGLSLLSDFGVRTVIIQSPRGENAEFLRSAWTFQCSRGIFLWLILLVMCTLLHSPSARTLIPSGSVFADSSFPIVTSVLGFNLVLSDLESTALSLNVRRLNFRPIVILDLTARVVPILFMVSWAYLYPSVWAIVAGVLGGGLLRAVLSHLIISGPRMRPAWRKDYIQEIVAFGKWINLSSLATFVGSQSDVILLGLLLPSPMLGIFYIAKTLKDSIETLLDRLNSSMTLPVLSEVIRINPDNLKSRYYRFRLPVEVVSAASAGFFFAAGTLIVNVLYDHRYADAGAMLQILSFGLLLYPFQLIRSGFTAIGRTNIVAWVSILQAGSLVLCLVVGYYVDGPFGAIVGVTASRIFPSVVLLILASHANWISYWDELRWIPIYALGFALGKGAMYVLGDSPVLSIRHVFH
jgi:O-antigen/teichoic acid export membrane protein